MTWLFAGYFAFFSLVGAYIARLVLTERRIARAEERLDRTAAKTRPQRRAPAKS